MTNYEDVSAAIYAKLSDVDEREVAKFSETEMRWTMAEENEAWSHATCLREDCEWSGKGPEHAVIAEAELHVASEHPSPELAQALAIREVVQTCMDELALTKGDPYVAQLARSILDSLATGFEVTG